LLSVKSKSFKVSLFDPDASIISLLETLADAPIL
jgi:hypothetical protein